MALPGSQVALTEAEQPGLVAHTPENIAVADRKVAWAELAIAAQFAQDSPVRIASHNRVAVPTAPAVVWAVVVLRLPLSHSMYRISNIYKSKLPYLLAKHIIIITF